jgi:phage-related tail fiber protein
MANANSQFGGFLTNVGVAKQTNANALQLPWKITRMQLGDGGGEPTQAPDPVPRPDQTGLIRVVHDAPLNALYPSPDDPGVLIAELVLPPSVGGFWIRESALRDEDGDLIAVAAPAPSYKPQLNQGSGRTQTIRMHVVFGNIANVQLKVDPSVVLATRAMVEAGDDQRQPLDATLTALARLVTAANQLIYSTGPDQFAMTSLTAFARTLLGDVDAAAARATLGAAPLASPELTGTPTAPTAAAGTNTTQIATTAFVRAAVAALVNSSPAALDTLQELAAALGNDPNFATTMTNALAGKLGKTETAAKATTLASNIVINGTSVNAGSNVTISAAATAGSVMAANAAANVGAVGTYALLADKSSTARYAGDTVAGSLMRFSSTNGTEDTSTMPAGTWRCMGRQPSSGYTVFLRIS